MKSLFALLALSPLAGAAQAQHLAVQEVPLTANHVLYDGINHKIYASIPGTAALNPNTVAQINAASGAVEAYILVGSNPDVLALSSDGSYLYVGIDGTSSVARIVLASNTVDQQFSLGSQYPYQVGNIVPLPGLPQSVAVSRIYYGAGASTNTLGIYDNGIERPTTRPPTVFYGTLTGSSSPNRLYSYDDSSTAFTFSQLNVDGNGITVGQTSDSFGTSVLQDFNTRIKFDPGSGFVYATNGTVVNPVALTDVGMYDSSFTADVVPSYQENRVYFLAGSTTIGFQGFQRAVLGVYNQANFHQVASFVTLQSYDGLSDLCEISPAKFVFRSDQGIELATPQTFATITVKAAASALTSGKTEQFTATGSYPDGTTSDVTSTVAWSSSNTAVATINSAGLAQGGTSGTANITATLGGIASSPFALTVTPAHYHVLWNNSDGRASIWNYDADNGAFTQNTYGPYPRWTAKTIADGGTDGLTRVLWDNTSGTASLWQLDNTAGTFSQFSYGPYSNWTANALSVSSDGTNPLLWDNSNGRTSIWNQEGDFGSFTPSTFGPYPGWTAQAIATDPIGNTQLLWDNADGRIAFSYAGLYNLPNPLNQITFGPYPGWAANALSVGTNGTTHILWNNTDGRLSLWNYNTVNVSFTQNTYGPYPNWGAKAITDGSDGRTLVLWDNTGGAASLWSLDNTSGLFTQHTFGPYPGWTAVAVSGN